jgi:hypothetical protein
MHAHTCMYTNAYTRMYADTHRTHTHFDFFAHASPYIKALDFQEFPCQVFSNCLNWLNDVYNRNSFGKVFQAWGGISEEVKYIPGRFDRIIVKCILISKRGISVFKIDQVMKIRL